MLNIKNLKVSIDSKNILNGVTLAIENGQIAALMGQNGSGKSTLAQTLMGHANYKVVGGKVTFDGKDILNMSPDARALAGIFLSFQYPSEIPGVTISSFLRMIYNKKNKTTLTPVVFRKLLKEKAALLDIKEELFDRYLNDGFSGGEKKRMEMLQMLVLEPKLAILDETDSGLDIDALKIVAKSVTTLKEKTGMSVLLITHYTRVLKYIEPDLVCIMKDGVIAKSGDKKLAHEIEDKGYGQI